MRVLPKISETRDDVTVPLRDGGHGNSSRWPVVFLWPFHSISTSRRTSQLFLTSLGVAASAPLISGNFLRDMGKKSAFTEAQNIAKLKGDGAI